MNEFTESSWTVRYSPKTIEEFALPKRIKDIFLKEPKDMVNHYYLFGTPGTSKTSLVETYLLQHDLLQSNYLKFRCSENSSIESIRNRITDFRTQNTGNDLPKFILFDEAEGLSNTAFNAIKSYINESEIYNIRFFFTSNDIALVPEAIIESRCISINFDFDQAERKEINNILAKLVNKILVKENNYSFENKEELTKFISIVLKSIDLDKRSLLTKLQEYHNLSCGNVDFDILKKVFSEDSNELLNLITSKEPISKTNVDIMNFVFSKSFSPERVASKTVQALLRNPQYQNIIHYISIQHTEYDSFFRNSTDKKILFCSLMFKLREIING